MITRRLLPALSFVLGTSSLLAAVPNTKFYPFGKADLEDLRKIVRAETMPRINDLDLAWQLYEAIQGSWKPNAPKPAEGTTAKLDALKIRLEKQEKPDWFKSALRSPQAAAADAQVAQRIGSATFEQQRETSDYQALEALAVVYLAEHELDRQGAADKAGSMLTVLTITHPWDWRVHSLYARLLIDAGLKEPGWRAALYGIFLNPAPTVEDFKFFAFVGRASELASWEEIQVIIRAATSDSALAARAIDESQQFFTKTSQTTILPIKK